MKTTVICAREFGPPETVVSVEEWELPAPQPGETVVEVLATPVNPADLNYLEGTYAERPAPPFVPGMEGVGRAADGRLVIAPIQRGWWCSHRVLAEDKLIPLPELPVATAAMLTVNPPTAYRLLRDFVALQPGDWLIQNAANSAVGRAVIVLARQHGWRTVNVVRRPELFYELRALGADVVVTDDKPLSRQIRDLTGGAEPRLALNAVGGESARQLAKSLARHGTLVTYGAMSREPLTVDNRSLIFQDIRFVGFWITDWYRAASRQQLLAMFDELLPLAGKCAAPVEQTYRLEQAVDALRHARQSRRAGKVLFVPGALAA
jgi:NADPH:quinone reductase-like Zn-dependent oxidoreductase